MGEGDKNKPISGGAPAVFISHASQDSFTAEIVCEALEAAGVKCWMAPRDVTPGTFYAEEIVHAIDSAKAIVLILSQNAATSPHVLREVERAASKRHAVISLRIDKAPLPAGLEYFLNTSQWLDASAGEVPRALPKLVSAVQLARESPAAPQIRDPSSYTYRHVAPARRIRRLALVGTTLIALLLVSFVAERLWSSRHQTTVPASTALQLPPPVPTATIADKSVAVLPFVDMSQKKDQEYFSDGLTEELIDRLAHSPDLKVTARTSSFQFKGSNEDVRSIAKKLGVSNVLEGSVRTSGKTLRVTAQLINAKDGLHRWSDTYERDIGDIFKLQDSISEAVVTALSAAIALPAGSAAYRPSNTDAYNAYLRGNYLFKRFNKPDAERALASFQDALRLDPRYADAWVGIAVVHNLQGLEGWIRPTEAYAEGRQALDQALKINPNLATAYAVLGFIESNFNFNDERGRAAFEKAQELDPAVNIGDSAVWEAISAGHIDEAIRLSRQLVQNDPLNPSRLEVLAVSLWAADRRPEAETALRHLLELNSSYAWGHCLLGYVLLDANKPDAALAVMREEANEDSKWCVADALWALGRRAEADTLLAEAKAKHADTQAFQIAQAYALREDKDEVLRWLNRAYDNRETLLYAVRQDPLFRKLRNDPRYAELVRKLKLPKCPSCGRLS